jgi:hypothetical protein
MRILTFFFVLALYGGMSLSVQAAPVAISAVRSTADTYSLFFVDAKGLRNGRSAAQAMLSLTDQLAVLTPPLKPCFTTGDLNATNIRCGSGSNQMQLGVSEIFSYNLETLLLGVPVTLERGVRQLMTSNFLSPNQFTIPATPGDSAGRVARIHFTGQMAQFGMLVDPGLFNSLNTIQFIVNGHALSPVALTGGVVQFVGVEDAQGFTDLTVIASGVTRAFVADKLAFLPLAKF